MSSVQVKAFPKSAFKVLQNKFLSFKLTLVMIGLKIDTFLEMFMTCYVKNLSIFLIMDLFLPVASSIAKMSY